MMIQLADNIYMTSDEHNWIVQFYPEKSEAKKPQPSSTRYYAKLSHLRAAVAEMIARNSEALDEIENAIARLDERLGMIIAANGVEE